jgi:flagella basal body P-ring formation protein FlgA
MLPVICFLPSSMAASYNIEDVLKEYIMENYPWADVEINNIVLSSALPEEMPAKINIIKAPPGKTVFTMEFKNARKVEAAANVRVFEQVVMSRRPMSKGSFLQQKDVYVMLMDIARLPSGFIGSTDAVVGKQLTRSIIANKPILDSMVSDSLLIKKGQRVAILAESPGLNVSTIGETNESAYVGSFVKVINISTKKIITGRLVDESTVRVEF